MHETIHMVSDKGMHNMIARGMYGSIKHITLKEQREVEVITPVVVDVRLRLARVYS